MNIAKRIREVLQLSGNFTLRSGVVSDTYFDKYLFESDPVLLRAIAESMAKLVPPDTEILAGLEMGGIPIATAISLRTGIPALFVRKKAKEYGTCKLAEGGDIDGATLVIIEDVVTSGGAVIDAVNELRQRGAIVNQVCCVIDRESTGRGNLEKLGLTFTPIFTKSELEQYAD